MMGLPYPSLFAKPAKHEQCDRNHNEPHQKVAVRPVPLGHIEWFAGIEIHSIHANDEGEWHEYNRDYCQDFHDFVHLVS